MPNKEGDRYSKYADVQVDGFQQMLAYRRFHRKMVAVVQTMNMQGGGDTINTPARKMKHKGRIGNTRVK